MAHHGRKRRSQLMRYHCHEFTLGGVGRLGYFACSTDPLRVAHSMDRTAQVSGYPFEQPGILNMARFGEHDVSQSSVGEHQWIDDEVTLALVLYRQWPLRCDDIFNPCRERQARRNTFGQQSPQLSAALNRSGF